MFIHFQTLQAPSPKTVAATLASVAAAAVLIRSIIRDHVPPELQLFVRSKLAFLLRASLSSHLTLVFEELVFEDGKAGFVPNHLFTAANTYLNPQTARFKATLPAKETSIAITMEANQEVVDFFNGVKLTWRLVVVSGQEKRFELSFHRRHRDAVLESYLPHVLEKSAEAREEAKALKLFALKQGRVRIIRPRMTARDWWEPAAFDHPSTFGTLAMEAAAKQAVMEDLRRFSEMRGVYRRAGRAWKRGYLLYGPPGTGKTSLVAAIANYMKFDVYDLELSGVRSNAELRKLVISMGSRSVIVVEDIDCAGELPTGARAGGSSRTGRRRITLSGLLNFIDGLWSSCGDERIVVLTTNHKDRLDPALLRPGRMDVHVHLSYCTPCGFRMLASSYLGVEDHALFPEVERLLAAVEVTPGEVGEELLKNEEAEASLKGLIKFLQTKKENSRI